MVQLEAQITFIEFNKRKFISKSFPKFICCICRREILEEEISKQCPKCQTYFHYKHLSIWLDINRSCPVCHSYLYQANLSYPRPNVRNIKVQKWKSYRCYYCNHIWKAKSSGYQLYCPECGITSCPYCKTAFGIEYLLKQLQLYGQCPKCNQYIVLESLRAKMTVL